MTQPATLFSDHIAAWPDPAQTAARRCRDIFLRIAAEADIGPLDTSLKWGQLSWRPRRPRTGSTLRMVWLSETPDHLSLLVDCKTDLATRMSDLYPDLPANDGRRCIKISITAPLPEQAVAHLARMTFTYHLSRTSSANHR